MNSPLRMKSQRVLIIDTNEIDFVNNENDYQKIVDIINKPYDPGINRVIP